MTIAVDAPTRPVPEWRIALAGVSVIAVSYGFARYGFGLFLPQLRREFGLSTSTLGVIGSVTYAGYLLALTLVGALATRVGPRPLLVCAGLSATVGMAVVAVAPTTSLLVAGLVLAGTSSGWAWAPYSDVVDRWVRPERQQHVMALLPAGTAFGVAIAGPLALLTQGTSWRSAWLVFSAIALLATAYNARTLPRGSRPTPTDAAGKVGLRWFARRSAAPLYLTALSYGLIGAVYWTFAMDAIAGSGSISADVASLFWTLMGVAGVAGVFTGALLTGLGLRGAHRALFIALAGAVGLLALAPGEPAVAAASVVLYGPAFMAVSGLLAVWSYRLFPDRPSTGFSATVFFLGLGTIVGPATLGWVADQSDLRVAFAVTAGVGVATIWAGPSGVSRRRIAAGRRTPPAAPGSPRPAPRRSPRDDG